MNFSKMIHGILRMVLALVLLHIPGETMAASSWEWFMSLRTDQTGDSMYMPSSVVFDHENERYYAIDTGRNRLISFGLDGKLIRAFTANDQLKSPFDMVRMDDGKLWVVEKGRNSLTLIDVEAKKIQVNSLKDGNKVVFPDRIASHAGKLFVLDRSSGQILRLNADLSVEQRYGCSDCRIGIIDFVIRDGDLFALVPLDRKVLQFNQDGTITQEILLEQQELDFPVSLDIGPTGDVYVLDRHKNNVSVFNQQGSFRYRFLGRGHAPGQLYFPRQLRFDPWRRLCVVDEGNGRVEIYRQ